MSKIEEKPLKGNVNSTANYRKIILNNIKHDLTNPINAILGYSELMMDIAEDENNEALNRFHNLLLYLAF